MKKILYAVFRVILLVTGFIPFIIFLKPKFFYISQKAKEKYPELINTEKELIVNYIVFKSNYIPIFQKYKNDLIKEYEAFIEE